MPPQQLRPYQQSGVARVFDAWRAGARKVLMVLPTGGGKTTIFGSIAHGVVSANRRAVVVVHRRELATQAAKRFTEFGTDFGYMLPGELPKPYAPLQIATVQTLVRRTRPRADLVICDEAHLSTAKSWQTVIAAYPGARILGVTATPWRLSGKPLASLYDESVIVATPRELRDLGFLSPYVGFSYLTPDLSEVKTTGGDYNERESAEKMSQGVIVDNVVEQWGQHARELSTVVFAVTVEHSRQLTDRFKAAGVSAEHLDGLTPLEARKAILKRVESGQTRVLCNVGVAVEGLDVPRLKCCILARPTKSLARAIQMMGRVRRPWQGVTARIHDHAFNIRLHGLPDADRDYSLNAKPEKPPSLTTCEVCLALYTGAQCPSCNHENAVKATEERVLQTVADAEQFTFESGAEEESPAAQVIRAPVEIRWSTPGKSVEGVYQKRWDEQTQWGRSRFYLVRGDRRDYRMPGTVQLNALMAKIPTGSRLRVTFITEKPLDGGRSQKLFRVEVDDGT
jgi:DNA repair protein RadD